jgi:hypothetical protein
VAESPDRGPLQARELLEALVGGDVEFVIVGGHAVIAHGYERATRDLDICPAPDRENLERLAAVLTALGARVAGAEEFEPDELPRPDADGLALGGNFVLATTLGGLDIMQWISPELTYGELAADASEAEVWGLAVRVCSYDRLVAMKEAAARPQDLADLANLRAIREDG